MTKKISLTLSLIFLFFFLSSRIFFFKPSFLETIASYTTYPVLKATSFVTTPIRNYFKNRISIKELRCRHTKLVILREKLLHENIKLKAMLHYNKKSKELQEFKNRYSLKNALLAKILVRTITPQEHSITVNRGSRDGVTKNMAAIYKFQLIGRVAQVTSCYSKVILITDSQSKVSAYANTSSARGIVEGSNKIDLCHLRHISHLSQLHNGDFVLSSGQGLVFPEGFCLGKIVNIKQEDVCYYVEIKPLVNLKTIEMCHLTNLTKMSLF